MIERRTALGALGLGIAISGAPRPARAEYPDRPIRLVVAYPPGGAVDVPARLTAEALRAGLGQPVVVENRPGAGGNVGTEAAARATPDGYTLLVASTGPFAVNPSLYRGGLPFDPARDFVLASALWDSTNLLLVPAASPVRSIRDLLALARETPGGLLYGSSGIGTSNHLAAELFRARAGIAVVHVPHRGNAASVEALAKGETAFAFDGVTSALPLVRAGMLRVLAVTSEARWPSVPEVPTMAEAGMPGVVVTAWSGLAAPARTPPAILHRLATVWAEAVRDPGLRTRMLTAGCLPLSGGPEGLPELLAGQQAHWAEMVRLSGARVE